MADYIKIYDDTILKQSIRQGTEEQRKSCMFTSGELAYTRDTKRVFVGDYSNQTNSGTPGGIIVGNKFILNENTHYTGDYTFDENYNNLIIYTSETDEQTIPIIKVDGTSIMKDVSNVISLGTVELNKISDYFSTDYFNHSNNLISLNDSIALNSITLNEIYPKTNDFISIPNKLKLNNIETSLHFNKPSEEITGKMTGFVEIEKIDDTYVVDFKPNNKTLTINLNDGLHDGKNPNNNILTIDNETSEISIGLKIDSPQNSQDSSSNQDSDLENHIIEKPKPIVYRISDNFDENLNTNFLFIISNPNTSQEQNDTRILSCIYKSNENFNNSIIGNDRYISSCVFGHSIPLEKEDYFKTVIDENSSSNQFASIQNSQDFIYSLEKSGDKFYFSKDSEQFGLQNVPIKTIQISTNNPSEMWDTIFDSNNASNDSYIFNTDDNIFKDKNKCPFVLKITTENSSESIFELLDDYLNYNQTLTITSDAENYTINGYECDQIYHQFTDGTNNTINVEDIDEETYKKSESKLLNLIKNTNDNNLIVSYKIYNGSEIIEQYDISLNGKSMFTDQFYVSKIDNNYYINENVFTSFELQLFGEDSSTTYDANTIYNDFEYGSFKIVSSVAYTIQDKMLKSISFVLNDAKVSTFDFNDLEFVLNEEDMLSIEKPYGTITELDFQFTDVTISSNDKTSKYNFQNFVTNYVDENNTIIAKYNIDYFEFKNSNLVPEEITETDSDTSKMIVYLKNAHGYKDTYKNTYTPKDDKEIEQLKCSSNAKYLLFESHSDLEYAELTYSIINNEYDIIENKKYKFPFQVDENGEIISNEQKESIKVIDVIDKSCGKVIQVPVSSNIFDSKSGVKINIQCSKLELPEIEPVLPDDTENPDLPETNESNENEEEEVITYKNKCNFVLRYIGYTV